MDGAQASHPHPAVGLSWLARRVGGRSGGVAAQGVSLGQTAVGADLGGSSKYSNERNHSQGNGLGRISGGRRPC